MRVLIDTCFWYSYLETATEDRNRIERAQKIFEFLSSRNCEFLIPYPTLYEALNTKLLRDKNKKGADWFLKQLMTNTKFVKIPDDNLRNKALLMTAKLHEMGRNISLVDSILRLILQDEPKVDLLVTFNISDFIDVCGKHNIDWIADSGQSFNW